MHSIIMWSSGLGCSFLQQGHTADGLITDGFHAHRSGRYDRKDYNRRPFFQNNFGIDFDGAVLLSLLRHIFDIYKNKTYTVAAAE
jgi:hypothetical protein